MSEQEIDTAAKRLAAHHASVGWPTDQVILGLARDITSLADALDRARAELAATQRAKRENDERFQLEAGEQRERAEQAEAELAAVRADFEQRTAVYDRNVEWCTRKVAEVARQRDALKAAVERVRGLCERFEQSHGGPVAIRPDLIRAALKGEE